MARSTGETQHLLHSEAVEKMKEITEHNPICLFGTGLSTAPISVRPMSTRHVDDAGNIWFLSPRGSEKNIDISEDGAVQLFYASTGDSEFMSVYGHAQLFRDKDKIDALWSTMAAAWFDGKDDPEITVIKVTPEEAYYWDTKDSKAITLMKLAAAAVTGKDVNPGVKGKLKV